MSTAPIRSFRPGAFQAHTAHISGNVLADLGCEDAVKMGHREPRHCRQHFPVERFVDVLEDILGDLVDALVIILKGW